MAVNVALDPEHGGRQAVIRVGRVVLETPPIEHVAFYIGLDALAAAGVVEWPLAIVLMASHMLLDATDWPALHELGEVSDAVEKPTAAST